MVVVNAVPPVATLYHLIAVPVAAKFATVTPAQNTCAAAVGTEVEVTVIVMVAVVAH